MISAERREQLLDVYPILESYIGEPLLGVLAWTEGENHNGFSPWGLSWISRHRLSPKGVVKALDGSRVNLAHCSTTHLPIYCTAPWGSYHNYHDEDLRGLLDDLPNTYPPGDGHWERWNLEAQLERFGGANWRRHARWNFNPWGGVPASLLKRPFWDLAREIYDATRRKVR